MKAAIRKRVEELERAKEARKRRRRLEQFRDDPCGYAREELGVVWTPKQQEIAALLFTPPYKVLCKASHSVGKTYLAAGLVNHQYDCFDPSATITTAPTHRDVCDLLWREVRLQRKYRGDFIGTSSPEMRSAPDHYAKGFTAAKGESFQGRHQKHMLFIFDEAVGIDGIFWETTKSMFIPDGNHHWLAIFNPTDTSSQAYQEEASGEGWHVVTMSADQHPNITAARAGTKPPYPGAVTLGQLEEWIRDWCTPIAKDEARATDFNWPPGGDTWFRPGPLFESRALGRWPSAGSHGVWSDLLFGTAEHLLLDFPAWHILPEIGCDVARFGEDFTAIHVRVGPCSVWHERHNGWDAARTVGRLQELCRQWAAWANERRPATTPRVKGEDIVVKVDSDGMGGAGVVDHAGGYAFVGVSAAGTARHPDDFPNTRSELWFYTAGIADMGRVSLSRLDRASLRILRRQCLGPEWQMIAGRCTIEPKEKTKDRLGASPDDADAMNLAYWPMQPFTKPPVIPNPKGDPRPREGGEAERLGLFGKGKR